MELSRQRPRLKANNVWSVSKSRRIFLMSLLVIHDYIVRQQKIMQMWSEKCNVRALVLMKTIIKQSVLFNL